MDIVIDVLLLSNIDNRYTPLLLTLLRPSNLFSALSTIYFIYIYILTKFFLTLRKIRHLFTSYFIQFIVSEIFN